MAAAPKSPKHIAGAVILALLFLGVVGYIVHRVTSGSITKTLPEFRSAIHDLQRQPDDTGTNDSGNKTYKWFVPETAQLDGPTFIMKGESDQVGQINCIVVNDPKDMARALTGFALTARIIDNIVGDSEAVIQYALVRLAGTFDQDALRRLREAVRERVVRKDDGSRDRVAREQAAKIVADLERRREAAYADKIGATDDDVRRDAAAVYERLLTECRGARRRLAELPEPGEKDDPTGEVEVAVGLLQRLHRFLGRVPDSMLRETFTRLGVEATVRFGAIQKAKRAVRGPEAIELRIGRSGEPLLTAAQALTRAREEVGQASLRMSGRGDRI